jgi:hypothetical protein
MHSRYVFFDNNLGGDGIKLFKKYYFHYDFSLKKSTFIINMEKIHMMVYCIYTKVIQNYGILPPMSLPRRLGPVLQRCTSFQEAHRIFVQLTFTEPQSSL